MGRAVNQSASAVYRPADNVCIRFFFHRYRFAGDHAFVHKRRAAGDGPVHRDLFPWTRMDQIPDDNLIDLYLGHLPPPLYTRGFRAQADQFANGLACLALGACFKRAPQQDQRDNHRCGLEIDSLRASGQHLRRKQRDGRKAPGRCGTEKDQRIHIRRAFQQRRNTGDKEAPPGPRQHDGGQNELDRPAELLTNCGHHPMMKRRDHMPAHFQHKHRESQRCGQKRHAFQMRRFFYLAVGW